MSRLRDCFQEIVMTLRSLLLASLLAAGLATGAAAQTQMVMVSGPIGGAWYPIGSAMTEILQAKASLRFTQQPGGGVQNAFNVGAGKAQIGFSTADVAVSAIKGTNDFQNRAQANLRLLAVLYPQEYTLVVWADGPIKSIPDLKGRVIQTTPRGSSTELMTRRVLEAYGMDYKDLKSANHSNLADGVNQMKDGQVDGMSHLITNPAAHALDLGSTRPIRVIALDVAAVDKAVKAYPGYIKSTIKAGTYAGMGEIMTIGEPVILVTRAELEDAVVHQMAKALVE
ncbi:MAG: TAXI family TRAP transporter solute-binding subunit, partial [Alphaproteobacteria bacterium]|nr:TAXI family TRAP transporter solute-binding subunit [Alphaproteobacteria bacterium]